MLWVNITNEDGELLDRFAVLVGIDGGEVGTANNIREIIERKFDTKDVAD